MRATLAKLKRSIVFLGNLDEKGQPVYGGTAFLVRAKGINQLVTAKHVIVDETGVLGSNKLAFFNGKKGKILIRDLDKVRAELNLEWIYHPNPKVDIAILPFPYDAETDDSVFIDASMFRTFDNLSEIYEVYFLSHQPGIAVKDKVIPIVRTGTISLLNDDKTFLIDGSAFPGNSGSPVFLTPSLLRHTDTAQIAFETEKDALSNAFIGLVGAYLPYQEVAISAQTKRPRVMFEENTGLSVVTSVDLINETTESEAFTAQLARLKTLKEKEDSASKPANAS